MIRFIISPVTDSLFSGLNLIESDPGYFKFFFFFDVPCHNMPSEVSVVSRQIKKKLGAE